MGSSATKSPGRKYSDAGSVISDTRRSSNQEQENEVNHQNEADCENQANPPGGSRRSSAAKRNSSVDFTELSSLQHFDIIDRSKIEQDCGLDRT